MVPNTWNNISITGWLTSDTLTIRFKGANETGDTTLDQWRIDTSLIHVWSSDTARYMVDLEVQWTSVNFSENNETLYIYGGTMGSEDIRVDVWHDSAWNNLLTDLSAGWNNKSISQYLTSSTFTIRFKGGSDTSDIVNDTWQIDVSLLHVWTKEYSAEVELSGNSNLYDWTQISWTVDSSWTEPSMQVTLQLYNYSSLSYPTSGDGHISYTSGAADTDETKNEVITTNSENFRNATGGWKIKLKGVKNTETQFNLNVDLTETAPPTTASTQHQQSSSSTTSPRADRRA